MLDTTKTNPNNKPHRSNALGTKKHAKSSTEFTRATLPKKRAHSRCLPENTKHAGCSKPHKVHTKKNQTAKHQPQAGCLKKENPYL